MPLLDAVSLGPFDFSEEETVVAQHALSKANAAILARLNKLD